MLSSQPFTSLRLRADPCNFPRSSVPHPPHHRNISISGTKEARKRWYACPRAFFFFFEKKINKNTRLGACCGKVPIPHVLPVGRYFPRCSSHQSSLILQPTYRHMSHTPSCARTEAAAAVKSTAYIVPSNRSIAFRTFQKHNKRQYPNVLQHALT